MKFNDEIYCGYSPERINPGDKNHTITKIKKVTSGSNNKAAKIVDNLYKIEEWVAIPPRYGGNTLIRTIFINVIWWKNRRNSILTFRIWFNN